MFLTPLLIHRKLPVTARTAGSCERTGATKAPVLSPAIFSTGGFTPGFGGKRVLAALSDFRHTASTRAVKELLWARGCLPAPSAPHSGSHGQTGVIFSSLCPSAFGPSKVGVGVSPQKAFGCQWQAKRSACPAERQDSYPIYHNVSQNTPCSIMASATRLKPAMLAPATRL